MNKEATLPQGATPFVLFAQLLRRHNFAISPDQTQTFIQAVGLLGPRSMRDIHRAARATLAPPIERLDVFDALFRQLFLGQTIAAEVDAESDNDDELQVIDERDGSMDISEADDINEAGAQVSELETLSTRNFAQRSDVDEFQQFKRYARTQLPHRRTLRYKRASNGSRWDLKRSLRDALRRDGEVLDIPMMARTQRQRRILLLIDISGSMKEQTDLYLRFAHTLGEVTERLEVFTLGTRLTRVSRALKHPQQDQALARATAMVADWDGGTRLGDALSAFLDVPRFAGFTRSALVVVLSDGLERGDPHTLIESVRRLSRLAWHLAWLTPLAADTHGDSLTGGKFQPSTEALKLILPYLDGLDNGVSAASLCRYVTTVGMHQRTYHRRTA